MALNEAAITMVDPKQSTGYKATDLTVPTPPASPPLPTPRTINELISQRARLLPDEPILGYPTSGGQYEEYTFAQLELFSEQVASIYANSLEIRQTSSQDEKVVAILGLSSLDYFITTLALSRLGFTVLFLSTRLSETAYLSLLEVTKAYAIVTDPSFKRTTSKIASKFPNLQVVDIVNYQNYAFSTSSTPLHLPSFNMDIETTKISWIIHSSGSTGLPKPIYQTHSAALRNYENNMNMRGFITLPLFHAHGLSSVFRAITSVKKIYMYNATLPLTRQNLLDGLKQQSFEIFYGVPYALKLLSESEEGIQTLAAMKVVMFGGSACPDALGDLLVDGGVNLISHYGTTETGQLMTSFRPQGDKAWNYVRVHDKLKPFVRWEERGANMFELVVLAGWPSKVATNRPDGSYATKDMFERHPSISDAWKYCARLDDTIVLMNGEKAIPIAMEQSVRRLPSVKEAMMFGSGKSRLGMIIVSTSSTENTLEAVWPTISKENAQSPAYAHITKEMITILPPETNYPQTDKGTAIRQAFYRTFQNEIERVYQRLETQSSGTLVLDFDQICKFLLTHVLELLHEDDRENVTNGTDLFSLGIDSLQSTRLRDAILSNLQLNGHTLPQNVVFENPTISKLASALISIREGGESVVQDITKQMEQLVVKYANFSQHVSVQRISNTSCVVVTGATGSLGAHIVAQLAVKEDVDEIWCLVRAKTDEIANARVVHSMQQRAVYHSLPLLARRKIKCMRSDFSIKSLGLSDDIYEELTRKVSSVIHCAWSVNFNKSLSSFENDCIAGACNLMNLCISAKRPLPASFNFCSSVSTVANSPGNNVEEALPESFSCAQGMGYAQSKLVTEHLVVKAAEQTKMTTRVLRVGQIIADTQHGIWNATEAIPLMLQAATTIRAIPTLDEEPRWLSVDVVATTVLDVSLSDSPSSVLNIVNPFKFHWTNDLVPCLHRSGLEFDHVTQREWIRRLRDSDPDPVKNPTFKLLSFFSNKYDHDELRRKRLSYTTTSAQALSPALSSQPILEQSLVSKFISHFVKTSWSPNDTTPSTRLLVVSGPCGSGKSTLAALLSSRLSCPMLEGDAIHDSIAIAKMSSGIPLDTLDRHIWLARLKERVLERIRAEKLVQPGHERNVPSTATIIVTCSALKRSYRDALRNMLGDGSITTQFITLQASEEELVRRTEARIGHYMKSEMVLSQLAAIEEIMNDETDIVPLDSESSSVEKLVDFTLEVLGL